MIDRPYTVLSCSMSLDGYLDDASDTRLVLSNAADLDRVDELRAGCDAILVGAATIRSDNPRLVIRDPERRARRIAAGRPVTPTKVTLTAGGALDPNSRFFTRGDCEKLVYCPAAVAGTIRSHLGGRATVIDVDRELTMSTIVDDLSVRGITRLMVEGGGRMHTQFLAEGLADELQVTVAPFFIGDSRAKRFVGDGHFPWCADRRAELIETRRIGDVALLRYALSHRGHSATLSNIPTTGSREMEDR